MAIGYQRTSASIHHYYQARVYLGTLNDTLTWVPGNTLCCVLQLEGTSGNLNAFNGWNLNLNAFNGDYSTNPSGWYTEEDPKEIHTRYYYYHRVPVNSSADLTVWGAFEVSK